MSDDEGPPRAHNAHERPRKRSLVPADATRRSRRVDPRFDPIFGPADIKQFESNYKFLREQEQEEQRQRQLRIKRLRCIMRRHTLEASGADLEEYDLSDDEREVFGDDHLDELTELKLTPPEQIQEELEQLKRASQLVIARTKDSAATSRKDGVKKALMKQEVAAVRAGTKSRMYFPKRSELKRVVLSDTFDRLEERGGKGAVDRYLQRKVKRR